MLGWSERDLAGNLNGEVQYIDNDAGCFSAIGDACIANNPQPGNRAYSIQAAVYQGNKMSL